MADLIGSAEEPEICFGEHRPSVVLESGQIWMDQALPLREGAARLAHLQNHIQVPTLVPGEDCLDRALEREVQALEIELQWRLDLAVNSPFWAYGGRARTPRTFCALSGRTLMGAGESHRCCVTTSPAARQLSPTRQTSAAWNRELQPA